MQLNKYNNKNTVCIILLTLYLFTLQNTSGVFTKGRMVMFYWIVYHSKYGGVEV